MKSKTNLIKVLRIARSYYRMTIKSVILITLILAGIQSPIHAQMAQDKKPSWWFGAAAGANINFYRGSVQELNSDLISPVAFNKGSGVGLYFAPLVEFYRPGSTWGIILQAGYDSRKGSFKEEVAPCGCYDDLSTSLSYITVEPSLRFAPFKTNFYLYAGPRLAFNLNKSFIYSKGINTGFTDQDAHQDMKMDFSTINKTIFSMQIGAGYDIPMSQRNKQTQYVLSPFISFQPYFGQSPRSIEKWNITTLRLGVAIKFSIEHKMSLPLKNVKSVPLL